MPTRRIRARQVRGPIPAPPRARLWPVALAAALCAVLLVSGTGLGAGRPDSGGGDSSGSSSGAAAKSTTTTTTTPGSSASATPAVSRTSTRATAEASAASLRSEREAVRAEVAELQRQRDEQFDRWALNQMALEAAQLEVAGAQMRAEKARLDALAARERLTTYASEAFMNPPAAEALAVLSIGDATDASRAHDLISVVAEEQRGVVGEYLEAQQLEVVRGVQAEQKAAEAREWEAANAAELTRLDELLQAQRRLDAAIDERLDAALAEVAALEAVDRKAAQELEARERALSEESKAAVAGTSATRSPASASPSEGGGQGSGGKASEPQPQNPSSPSPAPAPTTTTTIPKPAGPPPAPPTGLVTWQDVTKVGGIWVHKSIASRVQGLLDAAAAAGVRLSGGGFRDPSDQIRLRQAHCGPTEYDVYFKPASQCTPPTAPPGKSMHEKGLAIDFTVGGKTISSRSDPAFQWLAANAASYGLYNLPSEPWHWSTNGT